MTCGCVIFLLFGSRMLRFDDITMNLMFWRSDYNEICATKGLKKENDPANSQIFWHLEMFFFWGGWWEDRPPVVKTRGQILLKQLGSLSWWWWRERAIHPQIDGNRERDLEGLLWRQQETLHWRLRGIVFSSEVSSPARIRDESLDNLHRKLIIHSSHSSVLSSK